MNISQQRRSAAKGKKRVANKRLRELESDVADYTGSCLFVTDDNGGCCGKPVSNNCHIVSESAVLDRLKDDETKKVLELQWGVSQWRRLVFSSDVEQRVQDTSTFDPSERTTHDACMGRFACKLYDHDGEFQPIDIVDPDFDDPVVRFLSGYRLVLFLADQCRMAIELQQKWGGRKRGGQKRGRNVMRDAKPHDRALWRGEAEKLMGGFRRAEATVKLLGKNWHARKTGGDVRSRRCVCTGLDVSVEVEARRRCILWQGYGRNCVSSPGRLAQDGHIVLDK